MPYYSLRENALKRTTILYDPFFHIVAVNEMGMSLHDITEVQLDTLLRQNGHVNFLYFIFHPQAPLRTSFGEEWATLPSSICINTA